MDMDSKMPDRINITKKAREIISKIDNLQYFGLQDGSISRSSLFLFAMSLGAETLPTKLENTYPGGLVLENSIETRTKALMYALFIINLKNDNLDDITQKDSVYSMAQEYANTGFEIIEDYMDTQKDIELVWNIIEELDAQYKRQLVDI